MLLLKGFKAALRWNWQRCRWIGHLRPSLKHEVEKFNLAPKSLGKVACEIAQREVGDSVKWDRFVHSCLNSEDHLNSKDSIRLLTASINYYSGTGYNLKAEDVQFLKWVIQSLAECVGLRFF